MNLSNYMSATQRPKYFVIDVDGTFTDGTTIICSKGSASKSFAKDNWQGISLLRNSNIQVVLLGVESDISLGVFQNSVGSSAQRFFEETKMGVDFSHFENYAQKEEFIRALGITDVVLLTNDMRDMELLAACYMGIVPADARPALIRSANSVTAAKAGRGTVYDACATVKEHLAWKQ